MRSLDSNSMENSRKRVVVSKTLTYESTPLSLNDFVRGYSSNTEVYLTFTLTLRSAHLYHQPYSPYQQFLYNTLSDLQDKGMNFTEIAHWMNEWDKKF